VRNAACESRVGEGRFGEVTSDRVRRLMEMVS